MNTFGTGEDKNMNTFEQVKTKYEHIWLVLLREQLPLAIVQDLHEPRGGVAIVTEVCFGRTLTEQSPFC